ncbi:MAG: ASCH domain-containing protein [Caldilineaceae bacterium]|nr:ASCH domain-containing protein [Caldilineaceae bacterium]
MKAISLTQPWATLVAMGAKRIETRSWPTSYRGPLMIHASKGLPGWVAGAVRSEPQFAAVLGNLFDARGKVLGDLPRGHVIAACLLVSVKFIRADEEGWDWTGPTGSRYSYPITDQERAFGDYTPGRYAWLLAHVQPIVPVPARGALGLWEWIGNVQGETARG